MLGLPAGLALSRYTPPRATFARHSRPRTDVMLRAVTGLPPLLFIGLLGEFRNEPELGINAASSLPVNFAEPTALLLVSPGQKRNYESLPRTRLLLARVSRKS